MKKNVVIIGAGPAGLSTGYEILDKSDEYNVIILEKSNTTGGISRTVVHNGNRMDIGGHRFFSKDENIVKWWLNILPMQNMQSIDDILLNQQKELPKGKVDPEKEDKVMLKRNRVSRIFYNQKFFDYPIRMKFETIKNLGLKTTLIAGVSYLFSVFNKKEENSLENFYINRFGKKLYSMFFENYTEKLWGRHPKEISADWGKQRVKGLSVFGIIKDIFFKLFPFINHKTETSLIEEFMYPKLGPGQLWETVAEKIQQKGGKIFYNCEVIRLNPESKKTITYLDLNKKENTIEADFVVSSMPIKDLIQGIKDAPSDIKEIAYHLPYRDFVTTGILVQDVNLKNKTNIKTLNQRIPDCWIYVQDSKVKMGRMQFFNNWSPYMVKDYKNTLWIGLEYFCRENDDFWNLNDNEMLDFVSRELIKMNIINKKEDILDFHTEHVEKAYPAYFDSYKDIDKVINYLNSIENLYCVGRNGQHRYNNMDHSMMSGFLAAKSIVERKDIREEIWNVNTEEEYHESK